MPKLSERRKADRALMAAHLENLVTICGATAKIEDKPYGDSSPRLIRVEVEAARGLRCGFDFDGDSTQPDVFVNPWHMSLDTDACLSDVFPGSVNPYHFTKSTTVCHGFDELCQHVKQVLEMAKDGTAFDPAREAASIKKNGTAAERNAKWAEYRAEWQADKAAAAAAQNQPIVE